MTTPQQSDPMGGMVAGSADLQATMDQLNNTMRDLVTAVNGMDNGNGTSTSPSMAPSLAAQGVNFTNGQQGSGGNNGSGGTNGTNPFSFSMGGFNSSSLSGLVSNPAQAAANVGTSIINSQFMQAAQQLNPQAQINTYGYQQAGFWSVSAQSAIQQNFGGGAGHGLYQNNLATSATDARYGGILLSQMSSQANYASPNGGTYGRGNAPYQLAAATGLANPGLGMQNSASVSGAWYNPSTSYNLMMMGIANTPLQIGTGKANSMTGVEDAIGQRFGFQGFSSKSGTFNNQNLSANLNNPLFQMQIMQATGMSQPQYNAWSQQWAQENQWANAGGITMNQLQSDVSTYMDSTNGAQQGAALSALKKIPGFNMSLLQSMNQAQAGQTATQASGNVAFVTGLQNATNAIDRLTNLLSGGVAAQAGAQGGLGATASLNASGVSGAGGTGAAGTAISAALATMGSAGALLQTAINDINNPGGTGANSAGSGRGGVLGAGVANNGVSGSSSTMPAWAKSMMTQFGWGTTADMQALQTVEMNEAGWDSKIWNGQGSGAFGIAQALGHGNSQTQGTIANAYGPYGGNWFGMSAQEMKAANSGDSGEQFKWMLGYIKLRYGSPSNLLSTYENRNPHWYADGTTSTKPGLAVVGERGPELVSLSGGQGIINAAQTAKMMQPSFSGGISSNGGGGVSIVFQSGAITMSTTGGTGTSGVHSSSDVQSNAAQLEQAIDTLLRKNTTLKNIAMGVTG